MAVVANRLAKLNTQHRAAARLKVEGHRIAQISVELGVKDRTLHVWFSDPLMKAEIARLVDAVEDVFLERKATIGLRALETLSDFAEMPAARVAQTCTCRTCGYVGGNCQPHGAVDPKCDGPWDTVETRYIGESTKLDALRELLDRVDHTTKLRDRAEAQKAVNAGDGEGGASTYIQILNNATDEDLALLLSRWSKPGAVDGPPGTPALQA